MSRDPDQFDFFAAPVFPVRIPVERLDVERYRSKIKRAMSKAIRESGLDRGSIAARMAQYLGLEAVSRASLDAYTSESKATHDVSLLRFAAFVHATRALWLWDEVASVQGVTVLIGEEAKLAELARLQQERRSIEASIRALRRYPVTLVRKES
jgi:hypothetical protein